MAPAGTGVVVCVWPRRGGFEGQAAPCHCLSAQPHFTGRLRLREVQRLNQEPAILAVTLQAGHPRGWGRDRKQARDTNTESGPPL